MEQSSDNLVALVKKLTGHDPKLYEYNKIHLEEITFNLKTNGIGYSQFNELLLLLGYDRISPEFFRFLVDGDLNLVEGKSTLITSFEQLREGVQRISKISLILFGNIKFGYKKMSTELHVLYKCAQASAPIDKREYSLRHNQILPITPINGNDAYYLGYLIKHEIEEKKREGLDIHDEEEKMIRIQEIGRINNTAYLTSDHLDVYIATSMRERHEYLMVNNMVKQLSNYLKDLHLRWFDPTQAYCNNRLDKGLVEGLMLKRAKCTLYFSQEIDTIGKDSELASTLAQGKPVVAFVPRGDKAFVDSLLSDIRTLNPDQTEQELLLKQLRIFDPNGAWNDPTVRAWLDDPNAVRQEDIYNRLLSKISEHYDKRAEKLKTIHHLGIQVFLKTGVANGVLVARTVEECDAGF